MIDLDAIEARLNAATPGAWHVRRLPGVAGECFVQAPRLDRTHPYDIEVLGDSEGQLYPKELREADAEFIGRAKQDIKALIDRIRELEGELVCARLLV